MARGESADVVLTPELLLRGYAIGIFPMAESADDPGVHWVDPQRRGVLLPGHFHAPRSLLKTIRRQPFEIRVDSAFPAVVDACAAPAPGRTETWINGTIRDLYLDLFRIGHAHSVEAWDGGELVGGLYGVSLGGAFFGESMFSRRTDASKLCLCYLWDRLMNAGYQLLDTQFLTTHLARFGTAEIARSRYLKLLEAALPLRCDFHSAGGAGTVDSVLQSVNQTS